MGQSSSKVVKTTTNAARKYPKSAPTIANPPGMARKPGESFTIPSTSQSRPVDQKLSASLETLMANAPMQKKLSNNLDLVERTSPAQSLRPMPQKIAYGDDNPRSGLEQTGRLTAEQVEMLLLSKKSIATTWKIEDLTKKFPVEQSKLENILKYFTLYNEAPKSMVKHKPTTESAKPVS
eukprot:m.94297 g.94297  ORF g.94297 m.94297 type:complete len:179 (+) comp26705_c1_seq1:162-698(+)